MKEIKYVLEEHLGFLFKAISIIILFIIGLVLIIIGFVKNNNNFILGGVIFPGICLFLIFMFMFNRKVAYLDSSQIKVATFLGSKIKTGKWADLCEVEIRELKGNPYTVDNSICLYFNQGVGSEIYYEFDRLKLLKSNNVIFFDNTKKNRKVLKEYLPEQFKHVLDDK